MSNIHLLIFQQAYMSQKHIAYVTWFK